jgi:hypothetical protein
MSRTLYWRDFILGVLGSVMLLLLGYAIPQFGTVMNEWGSRVGGFVALLLFALPLFIVRMLLPWSWVHLKGSGGIRFFFVALFFFVLGVVAVYVLLTTTLSSGFSAMSPLL